MKYKTTRKEVMSGYFTCYRVGYCEMQALLRHKSPEAYTSGVYGWNADIYRVDTPKGTVAIATGYRPFGNAELDRAKVRESEKLAEKITNTLDMPWEEKAEKVNTLLVDLLS